MKTTMYINNEKFIAGMTMKDKAEPELNNMALHVCKDPEKVLQNRRELAADLNIQVKDFVCANQTHSANFHKVTLNDAGKGSYRLETAVEETDALYTHEPNVLLTSFSADCVPLLFFHEESGLIGAIHSGWQGTVKEITLKLFEHLKQEEGCTPGSFHVQIGAALSQEKFEVDEDVYLKFKNLGYAEEFMYFNEQTGKYHIDNQLAVKRQCELAGIPAEQIEIDRTCTYMSPAGFSYRQDRKSGRHMSFIMKKIGQ
ncbi:peptidoglycan editing factor PgeF [Planomicrobium sp. CPCC 101110]|uniref:peptidoglycan editing factor PgeF n=1 Tax=Planomicrobium sp. CPCC 101110 TaxID=2599619 RepID=UPI0011B585EC|nr:peptidoglycan editing factor PgeF [Planomicrobium sp. CPCC 101110]TWT25196.1 peptidoglycan editing factor PgeF [Planomicrobium sp. CPCC 101110]